MSTNYPYQPDKQSQNDLMRAAVKHLETENGAASLIPVPGTKPTLYVAVGTLPNLQQLVELKSSADR